MLQRASAPPRGPRSGSPNVRGGGRGGGIQKRRGGGGPIRVDKDGDMDMDVGGAIRSQSGKGRIDSTPYSKGAGRGRGGPARGNNLNKAQAIVRSIGAHQVNIVESPATATLKIDGLSSSKAASNSDGGLESLLGFLERKAAGLDAKSNRSIRIKKVCSLI
jgi:nuclear RNA export factor